MLKNKLQSPPRRYFQLPNDIFNLGLSDGAILVYTYLMYCEDRKTYKCYPSFKTIGKAINRSRNSVSKYVRELEEKRLIKTEPTKVTVKTSPHHKFNFFSLPSLYLCGNISAILSSEWLSGSYLPKARFCAGYLRDPPLRVAVYGRMAIRPLTRFKIRSPKNNQKNPKIHLTAPTRAASRLSLSICQSL